MESYITHDKTYFFSEDKRVEKVSRKKVIFTCIPENLIRKEIRVENNATLLH